MQIAGYQCQIYDINVAGRLLRIAGPAVPDALLDDPEVARRFERDEYMPYWATPWPASIMLAEYLLGSPAAWRCSRGRAEADAGPEVLEIGAGLGIVSIALAASGRRAVATDYDADALAFIEANARLNGVSLSARRLDWREPAGAKRDCIVAADVLYETRNHLPLARFLEGRLSERGVAFVADPCRAAAGPFAEVAAALGLKCEVLAASCRRVPSCGATARESAGEFAGRIFRLARADRGRA